MLTGVMRRPERWLDGAPEESKTVPGIWSHLLTFLGGSHACIGFRFSLLECVPPLPPASVLTLTRPRRTKILLHALVVGLRFELGVPVAEVGKRAGVVTRPVLVNARAEGIQLPLLVARADD
jgi:hypothetical protein